MSFLFCSFLLKGGGVNRGWDKVPPYGLFSRDSDSENNEFIINSEKNNAHYHI